jgi:adenylyltransferase/sulfurtransferase
MLAREISRYRRHLIMPEVGVARPGKLKAAKVLLIGAGGLGAPVAMYLAAAGVGTIGLVDFDVVDVSNLQRQVIHGTKDIGKKKIDSAEETMRDINPLINIIKHEVALFERQRPRNPEGLRHHRRRHRQLPHPLFDQRRLRPARTSPTSTPPSSASKARRPSSPPKAALATAASIRNRLLRVSSPAAPKAACSAFSRALSACCRPPKSSSSSSGAGEPLIGRLLLYDALAMKFRELKLRKNPECLCATGQVKLIDYEQFCGIPKQPEPPPMSAEISPKEVKALIDAKENFVLIDVREPHEFQIGRIPTSTLIPLGDLPKKVAELDPSAHYVLHCKMGGRSAKGCDVLRQAGFKNVRNMTGGISAWSDQVDPSVPKY